MLKLTNVNVFIGKKRIVKDVTFQVKPGEIIGLVGPNGAGKTTIMKTILGLTKFKGEIALHNQKVTETDHRPLIKVGALIEHPAIYPFLTGLENLELYSQNEDDTLKLVSMLQMDNYIKKQAKGYSLGMKQKLGIAIALLNKPELVILDEPMNGLDVEATIMVRKIIKQYAEQGTAFLISSHVLSELQKVMTGVVLINNGEIIADKTVEEFNKLSRQKYKLDTEDVERSVEILTEHQIAFEKAEGYLVIKPKNIYEIQDVLHDQGIHLKEVSPLDIGFEHIIVTLLQAQRSHHHEK
jgi:ABC-2 type transport system ATP-binding protein